jgi:hypothetical protein
MAAAIHALLPDLAAAAKATPERLPLLHLENSRGVPLYTLSRAEADNAVAKHGFTLQPHRHGYLWTRDGKGVRPIYRLTKVGGNGWVLVSSPTELRRLVDSKVYRNEGVVGYASKKRRTGTVVLSRYSKPNVGWRVSLPAPYGNPQALINDGYRLDGPLGHVRPE